MESRLSLVNPVRKTTGVYDFHVKSTENIDRGWLTNVALDLNVIHSMEQHLFHSKSLEDVGLVDFINIIKDSPVVLMPGFAIGEVKKEFAPQTRAAFEAFTLTYFPHMRNAPGTNLDTQKDLLNSRLYNSAIEGKKETLAKSYIAMMLLFLTVDEGSVSQESKFQTYFELLTELTGGIGFIEFIVAQFVFYDRSKALDETWKEFCKTIKNNFLKSRGSADKVLLNSYNQAHDLYIIRAADIIHGAELEGGRIDYWFATCDVGLTNLCGLFYFEEGDDGFSNGKVAYLSPFSEMVTDSFWKYTNEYHDKYMRGRFDANGKKLTEDISKKQIERNVETLEKEVRRKFS